MRLFEQNSNKREVEVFVGKKENQVKQSAVAVAVMASFLMMSAGSVRAASTFWNEAGVNAGAGLANLLYVPAKAIYATLGMTTGGVAYCVTGGDLEVANEIWNASVNGTWVITPAIIQGQDKVRFSAPPRPITDSLREYDAPAAVPDTTTGDSGYGTPAPRYEDQGSDGSDWN